MATLSLFTDGSVNPCTKIGYGAYLVTSAPHPPCEQLARRVVSKRFTRTSSTQLEIQTLLWAIDEIIQTKQLSTEHDHLTIYTDCQTIVNLPNRQQRLEQNNYCSKNNTPLKNGDLYRQFFNQLRSLNFAFIKVQGHQSGRNKKQTDQIFSLVDRHARHSLRFEQKKSIPVTA